MKAEPNPTSSPEGGPFVLADGTVGGLVFAAGWVISLKEELFTLRFQAATGQLESHGRLRAVRKDIARIYTVLTERELGIVDDPDAEESKS